MITSDLALQRAATGSSLSSCAWRMCRPCAHYLFFFFLFFFRNLASFGQDLGISALGHGRQADAEHASLSRFNELTVKHALGEKNPTHRTIHMSYHALANLITLTKKAPRWHPNHPKHQKVSLTPINSQEELPENRAPESEESQPIMHTRRCRSTSVYRRRLPKPKRQPLPSIRQILRNRSVIAFARGDI